MGVQTDKLKLFYITNVCRTSFLCFLTKQQVYELEKVQRFATRLIIPQIDSYTERLSILGAETLKEFIENVCLKFSNNVVRSDSVIARFLPKKCQKLQDIQRDAR